MSWHGWDCEVSCDGHHRQRGKTTMGSALDGTVLDFTQILAYLIHNMSRSQLYILWSILYQNGTCLDVVYISSHELGVVWYSDEHPEIITANFFHRTINYTFTNSSLDICIFLNTNKAYYVWGVWNGFALKPCCPSLAHLFPISVISYGLCFSLN